MNFSLKPRQFLFALLPGFLFVIGYISIQKRFDFSAISNLAKGINLFSGITIIICSYIIGVIIDSVRDGFVEDFYDRLFIKASKNSLKPINWQYFHKASDKEIEKLDDNYYIWYVLDINFSTCFISFLILLLIECLFYDFLKFVNLKMLIFLLSTIVVSLFFLIKNIWALRTEISEITNSEASPKRTKKLPIENVYTRIKRSNVHGVGVFAIKFIPKGTNVFEGDSSKMVEIDEHDLKLALLSDDLRQLYKDFCVKKIVDGRKKYLCPDTFNNLTIGWYINHSENPNVLCDIEYNFIAARDIDVNEELTADYSTYSE